MSQEKDEKKAIDNEEKVKNNAPVDGNKEVKDEDLGKVSGGAYKPYDDTPYWSNIPF